MKYSEIEELLKQGRIAMLPKYIGYFKWDYSKKCPYMLNGDYITYNIDKEKERNDWFYII